MFGKNKKEQNDVDKYLSKKQRKAIAREEKDRIDRQKALEEVKYREIKGTQGNAPCLRYLSRCYRNPRWTFLQDYGS